MPVKRREPSAAVYSAAREERELKKEDFNKFQEFLKEQKLVGELREKFSETEIRKAPEAFKKAQVNEKLEKREVELLATVLKHLKKNAREIW